MLAVDAICPRSKDQPEKYIRQKLDRRHQTQVQGRAGQLVYQERQGEQREGAAQVRDGLPNPELPEVTAEPSRRCICWTRSHGKNLPHVRGESSCPGSILKNFSRSEDPKLPQAARGTGHGSILTPTLVT